MTDELKKTNQVKASFMEQFPSLKIDRASGIKLEEWLNSFEFKEVEIKDPEQVCKEHGHAFEFTLYSSDYVCEINKSCKRNCGFITQTLDLLKLEEADVGYIFNQFKTKL